MRPFVRNAFNYDTNEASVASGLACPEPSMTKQSDAEEADINTIMRKFGVTGQLPSNIRMPVHGDFRNSPNFHSAMNLIVQAREGFALLSADIRKRFGNDPANLVDFISDVKNRDEAVKLGLVVGAAPTSPASAAPGAAAAPVVSA